MDMQTLPPFPPAGGATGAMVRAHDWSGSPVGPVDTWPEALRVALALLLDSPESMYLLWGPELTFFFNDAYRPILGPRLADALGASLPRLWPDAWEAVRPSVEKGFAGEASRFDDLPIGMARHGMPEETWWTFSYSPVRDGTGRVAGLLCITNETTQRVRAAAALRASEARNRQILDSATDYAIVATDLRGRVTRWNEGAQRVIGWTEEEMLGEEVHRFFTPEDNARGQVDREMAAALRTGRGTDERWHLRRNGERFWALGEMTPLRAEGGEVVGFVKVLCDRTAQRLAAEALEQSERRYRTLYNAIDLGFCIVEVRCDDGRQPVDYRFLEVNAAFETHTGLREPVGRWMRHLAPGHEQYWFDRYAHIALTGQSARFEFKAQALGGRHFEVYAYRIGRPEEHHVAILFSDITDRRRAELHRTALLDLNDRLRDVTDPGEMASVSSEVVGHVLEAGGTGYATVDADEDGAVIVRSWAAPGVASQVGRRRMAELGTYVADLRRGTDVVIADVRSDPRTAGTAGVLEDQDVRALVNLPLIEGGRLVALFFVVSAAPRHWTAEDLAFIRDAAGRTRTAMERRRAEHGLRELTDSLEQQVEARTRDLLRTEEALRQSQKMEAVGQLTGGLAHDFNNLLTGVTGSLELLQTRIAQGRIKDVDRYVVAAQGAARRAAALTHRLLAFSRRQTLAPRPTDVNRLVRGMEELVRRTVGPAIEVAPVVEAAELWPTLIDPGQLENALLNLCINARDAMPDGGRLLVEAANRWLDEGEARGLDLRPGAYVSLCVSDTGTGMAPEVAARAFDPFFTTKPIGMGTGLGLSMIYGFAKQSGGQARIRSEVGRGTTVCLYLPRHLGEVEAPGQEPGLGRAPRAEHGQTVLVVDDEPTVRMLVTEVLEDLGYTAIEAADGAAGLAVLRSDARVDLLVTDVGLPGGMNGRQVADAARVARPALKVLFITGYAENAVLGEGQLDPGMHVLTKPFAMEALASRIRALISG